jgi:protein YIPF5/7
MSAIFDANSPYGGGSSYNPYGPSSSRGAAPSNALAAGAPNLQFYSSSGGYGGGSSSGGGDGYNTGSNGRPSLEGNMNGGFGGPAGAHLMAGQMSFWSAFGTGGFPDEPGLMEGELEVGKDVE